MSRVVFKPTHVLVLAVGLSLRIQVVTNDAGNYVVRKALFDDEKNKKLSRCINEAALHIDTYERMYFYHNRERYYLSEFTKMPQ